MKDELNEMIQLLERNSSLSNAYIDITVEDERYPTLFSGNPDGLRLLAAELLKRSMEIEDGYFVPSDIPEIKWVLTDNLPLSISGLNETREKIIEKKQNLQPTDKSSGDSWGCVIALVIVITLIIMGIIYLVKLF